MAKVYNLPVKSDFPNYSFQVDLDGQTYSLSFSWNELLEGWFMSIADVDGIALVSGVRVVVGFPLAARSTLPGMPPGVFLATDTAGSDEDPRLTDLGSRVQLQYLGVGDDG